MEKERYELHIYDDCNVDCYNNGVLDKSIITVYGVEQLLNKQSARIKELESKLRVSNSQFASSELKYNELEKNYKKQENLLSSYLKNCSELNLENQQLKEKLEVQKNKAELVAENEAMKDTIAVVLAQKSNVLKSNEELRKENQQLKQQLSDEVKAHDLCIDHFNEECEKLRKQIKFESDARERFKQSQNEKAIEALEKVKIYNSALIYGSNRVNEYIDDQLKKIRSEK